MVVQCCVCKRVHLEDAWEHVADPRTINVTATHGYCPVCLDSAYAEFHALQHTIAVASSAA